MTTRTDDPGALVILPGTVVPGRARPPVPLRREGPSKLTGVALYTDDIVVPGAWYGSTIRSTDAHAILDGIDLDPSFDWTTVVVVTASDIPGENVVSSIRSDQPILVPMGGEIRHHAEPLALLAAPDRGTLREARRRVRVRTTPLPGVFDPEASEHTFASYAIETGDAEAAMAGADLIFEGEYRVGHQEQLYIENNAMIAEPTAGGGVTVTGSLQCPYYLHEALKRGLGLGDQGARVIQAETGGGFGGKEEFPSVIGLHAALLARKAQRPVRMIYDRHEDIAATTKRHPAIVRHRTAVTREGVLVAQDIEVIMDGGAYCTLTPVVLSRGALHSGGPYRCPNVRIRARATRTNTPPNGAFRGFGAPQVEFAAETHLNRIAERLGISPLDIRRRNLLVPGDATPTGQVLRESVAAEEVLERAAEASEFVRLRARAEAERRRRADDGTSSSGPFRTGRERTASGIGIALGWHGAGFTGSGEVKLASVASVELTADGRIVVLTASTEMGQGTKTIFPQLVGEALGVSDRDVEIAPQDTAIVPDSGPTVASRTSMVVGGLVIRAAGRLREAVEREMGAPFAESYRAFARDHGALRVDQRFEPYPGGTPFDDETYTGDAYPAFSWAACVASVRVDLDTGEVQVDDVVAADDIGRVIHPILAEGQVEGGTLQAIGYATIEEIKLRDGRYLNDRLATYIIPTAMDAPRISAILVEAPFDGVPHGAKGVGELPMDVGAPAVVAAIADATGAWITDLPASPERILAALAAMPDVAGPRPGMSPPEDAS
ncbi:MAG: xanthine dehydrogenase family protein molybdopterin-binding subunit [Chloroflexota bacterium]|jgi:CO/xanthine dehydrogenase Mo-binding subunit|nr:xanthine dehydrogenase family protein molybdopterin-binding subunit [Chloroflexota bacterium]MDH5242671.1 xanthine dehydrogenase family protein molybdopterin-binding subunit [Chloroflexota bacterium]